MDNLFREINSVYPLKENEREALQMYVKSRDLKRKQHLLSAGDVCHYYAFVLSGCLRMYSIDNDGREHSVLFATEGYWIADLASFHHTRPSYFYIEAVEPTKVILLHREDLVKLWSKYRIFDRYFRVITEEAYCDLQMRLIFRNSVDVEQRYQIFREQYPHLVSRLPAVQIASYLGITPEFLSKIKKRMLGRK